MTIFHQGVAEIGFQRRYLVGEDHPVEKMAAAVLSMVGSQLASMVIGIHEDRERIIGDRILEPFVGLAFAML
jgi:hypothetical protein